MRVLFVCSGNAARSQTAEAILRDLTKGRLDVYSAGTDPQSSLHPIARLVLESRYKIETSHLVPKPLHAFVNQRFDAVITVCDEAAEACPVFPNAEQRFHWNFEDPAAVPAGPSQQRAFEHVASELHRRLLLWLALPQVSERLTPRHAPGRKS